jgi:hypothetical protein
VVSGDSEPFDPHKHQLVSDDTKPANGARVAETIAAGYTFQGQLLRPILVRLRDEAGGEASAASRPPDANQSQLPLEQPAVSV